MRTAPIDAVLVPLLNRMKDGDVRCIGGPPAWLGTSLSEARDAFGAQLVPIVPDVRVEGAAERPPMFGIAASGGDIIGFSRIKKGGGSEESLVVRATTTRARHASSATTR